MVIKPEPGKTYKVYHARKGTFSMFVVEVNDEFATGIIAEGIARGINYYSLPNDDITVKISLCNWEIVK